ncbi:hypothetical protein TNCV_606761 [Trichonephila clavipes]|nr:hypothetical protein TNCV_606761 [Trichonephila clavipes]
MIDDPAVLDVFAAMLSLSFHYLSPTDPPYLGQADGSSMYLACLSGKVGLNGIEEIVDLARQINLEVDNEDIQELLDSHNQELTMNELIEMHEQDIEEQ